jgi:hypothetical protein
MPRTCVIEFYDTDDRVVAIVSLSQRTMFWSEGRFEPGNGFFAYQDLFRRLERASKCFQASTGHPQTVALEELGVLWTELNGRLRSRERGTTGWLNDVGLHLDGARASIRF